MGNPTVVFDEPGSVRLDDRERPEPAADEVLIETTRSLVSVGTELTILSGEYPEGSGWDEYGEYPFDAGYCNVGRIVECGDAVEEDVVGRTVVTRAPHTRFHAQTYERGVHYGGVVPVPDAVDEDVASLFALAAIAMNGIRRGRVTWGETVACYGCGVVGQLAVRFARAAGARPVVGFDLVGERLAALPDDPAVVAADPTEADPVRVVEDADRGRPADVVIEATGRGEVVTDELDVLREQGRLVVLSSPRSETTLDLHDHCNAPSYEIVGAHEGSHPEHATRANPWTHERHFELFFDLVADGDVEVASLLTDRVPIEDAPSRYRELLTDRSASLGVVLEWD